MRARKFRALTQFALTFFGATLITYVAMKGYANFTASKPPARSSEHHPIPAGRY